MKYPCETCLVDTMCNEMCDSLIFFSDHLYSSNIPFYLINTENRTDRLVKCILTYGGESTKRVVRITNTIARERRLFKEKQNVK